MRKIERKSNSGSPKSSRHTKKKKLLSIEELKRGASILQGIGKLKNPYAQKSFNQTNRTS